MCHTLGIHQSIGREVHSTPHVSSHTPYPSLQIQAGMLRDPKGAVRRGQGVKVKVISITGTKLSLSMKEVDQRSGA